jgi:hypothetical protein
MEALVDKIVRVVNSCVTPEQLEIAENFAERAKKRVHREEWLDIACVIQKKAGQILFYDADDWALLKKV